MTEVAPNVNGVGIVTVPVKVGLAIGANVELRLTPPTVYILVDSTSVNHPFVTLAPVAAIEPVRVRLLAPKAKSPPETVKPPVAVATVILAVPSNETPPIVLAVCKAVAVPALPETEV